MEQLDLALARKRDPSTSKDAARRADTFKARHEAKIYAALKDYGAMIPAEIAAHCRLDAIAVSRRGAGMQRKGLVTLGPDTKEGCRLWRAV